MMSSKRTLYSLRNAVQVLYDLLAAKFMTANLKPVQSAPCVFQKKRMLVICYVDDLVMFSKHESEI